MRSWLIVAALAAGATGCSKPAPRTLTYKDVTILKVGSSGFHGLDGLENPSPAKATVLCTIGDGGKLRDCRIEKMVGGQSERRAAYDQGFLENAQTARVDTKAKDGSDARGQLLRLDIRFELKE